MQHTVVHTSGSVEERRRRWEEDGYLARPDFVSTGDIDAVAGPLDELYDRFGGLPAKSVHRLDHPGGIAGSLEILLPTVLAPTLRETAVFEACRRQAGELMGCEARFFFDHAIRKPARVGTGTPWHQDQAYNLVDPDRDRVHFWVPMADVDADGGCMQFVAATHRKGLLPHEPLVDDPASHALIAPGDWDAAAVAVPLAKGGVSMHHTLVMHKTGPNRSTVERTAWILHFVRPQGARERAAALRQRLQAHRRS